MRVRTLLMGGTAAVISATSPMFAAEAMAQQARPPVEENTSQVGDIVVTAQRRNESLEEVPISITAVTSETLEAVGLARFDDIGKIAVGTHISRSGVYVQPSIRGITSQTVGVGQDNNVAVYVDGFYQPSQMAVNTELSGVRNIQVLKGPQGTLFGRNATGGAIMIETADPTFTPTVTARVGYGNYNDQRVGVFGSTGLGENAAINLSAYRRTRDGYIEDYRTGADTNPLEDYGVRSKLLFQPNDALRVVLIGEFASLSDATGISVTNTGRSPFASIPGTVITSEDNKTSMNFQPEVKSRSHALSAQVKYDFGDVTLNLLSRYGEQKDKLHFDIDASTYNAFDQALGQEQKTFTQEVTLTGVSGRFDWVVGAFYYGSDQSMPYNNTLVAQPDTFFNYAATQDSEAYAAFADVTWSVTDALFLTLGGRYSSETKTYSYRVLPSGAVSEADRKWEDFTPRVVLRYEFAPNSSIYGSYTQGFKSGTFNATSTSFSPTPVDPEEVSAFEVGLKLNRGKWRFDTAAYFYEYDNLQVSSIQVVNGSNQTRLSNAATAEIYGLETQVNFDVTDALSVYASAAYTHARYVDFPQAPGVVINPVTGLNVTGAQDWGGQRIPRAPDVTLSAGAVYDWRTQAGTVTLGGNAYYSSEFAPTTAATIGTERGTRYLQDAYATLNLTASWNINDGPWTLAAYGRNITDTQYYLAKTGNVFGDYHVYAEPATYGVSLEFKY